MRQATEHIYVVNSSFVVPSTPPISGGVAAAAAAQQPHLMQQLPDSSLSMLAQLPDLSSSGMLAQQQQQQQTHLMQQLPDSSLNMLAQLPELSSLNMLAQLQQQQQQQTHLTQQLPDLSSLMLAQQLQQFAARHSRGNAANGTAMQHGIGVATQQTAQPPHPEHDDEEVLESAQQRRIAVGEWSRQWKAGAWALGLPLTVLARRAAALHGGLLVSLAPKGPLWYPRSRGVVVGCCQICREGVQVHSPIAHKRAQ